AADQAGAERGPAGMRIREDRIDVAGLLAAAGQRALAVRPRVVLAAGDDVDLLDREVADVADPERVRVGIEAHPERIAEPVREDLAALAGLIEERVVIRDRTIEVEAQDLAVDLVQVLRVGVRRRPRAALVVTETGVADADVEL